MYKTSIFFFIFTAGMLCNSLSLAARPLIYNGSYPYTWKCRPFSSNSLNWFSSEIDAEYQYILDEDTDERIFSGPFTGKKKEILKDKNGVPFESSISINGQFNNDQQDGEWKYKYVYKNTIITCTLNFKNGLLNGIQTLDINDDGISTLKTVEYKDGHYSGNYKIIGGAKSFDVNITFSPEGLPIGKWNITYGNEMHKISFDENNVVTKARTIDIRTGNIEEWKDKDDTEGIINWALRLANLYILPSDKFNLALMGENPLNGGSIKEIFNLLHSMRKTPTYADNVFITQIPREVPVIIPEQIYSTVDQDARFPGDSDDFNDWLFLNLKEKGYWFGKAGLSILVKSDGSISDVDIIKGINGPVDKSLKEAFKSDLMPKWIPAVLNGNNVSQRLTIYIDKPKKPKKK